MTLPPDQFPAAPFGTGTLAHLLERLACRDDNRCAACGLNGDACDPTPFRRQHPNASSPADGPAETPGLAGWLLLCGTATSGCRARVLAEPGWAREAGLTIAAQRDPAAVPVWHALHGLTWLDADGGHYPGREAR